MSTTSLKEQISEPLSTFVCNHYEFYIIHEGITETTARLSTYWTHNGVISDN